MRSLPTPEGPADEPEPDDDTLAAQLKAAVPEEPEEPEFDPFAEFPEDS